MTCIVCGSKFTQSIFNPGQQPLAALNLPRSTNEALAGARFPMNFHACAFCNHVFNVDFNYNQVPYSEDSNLMYNSGSLWQDYMQLLIDKLHAYSSQWLNGIAIDIGCGDGQFFTKLLDTIPTARCVGYEPGIEAEKIGRKFTVIRDYFIPERDLKRYRPSLLVCRHVIEHMDKPRDFVSEVAYWCNVYDLTPMFLVEVPCFDNSILWGRVSDFLYEHVSNFTTDSFKTLFSLTGYSEIEMNQYYGDEVIAGFFRANNLSPYAKIFNKKAQVSFGIVKDQLSQLQKTTQPVIFWGGTGKGAAFLNNYHLDMVNYPLVVDSDPNKIGRFVPGTGQEIQSPEIIRTIINPIIVITTPWRAKDIKLDIEKRDLKYSRLLVLQKGILSDC